MTRRNSALCPMKLMVVLFTLLSWFPAARVLAFDGDQALRLIREQCALGPRIPGQPAHEQGRLWIRKQLEDLGLRVEEQPFKAHLTLSGQDVEAVNLWGVPAAADGPTSPCIILSAHWDTRPWADQDGPGVAMLGANDGASGVAMALELARELCQTPLKDHLVLAFWDAEDSGVNDHAQSWALGARYGAAHPPAWVARVALGINLDLVAGEGVPLRPESYSQASAPWAVKELWALGGAVAPELFPAGPAMTVIDDHLPWTERGVPFIDLVGLPWRYWHTAGDRPENCSPRAMEAIGNVLYNFLIEQPWRRAR